MATNVYMTNRKKHSRPQGMLWSNNAGTLSGGLYIPNGYEVGQSAPSNAPADQIDEFMILSDDNRGPMDFQPIRLERRERMINGRMRSYHIADKLTISTSWNMLPSRSYESSPEFDTGAAPGSGAGERYTTDGGAGGVDILDWYENHQNSFWVYLAYDKFSNFSDDDSQKYSRLGQYNQIVEMYISSFNYSVQKRGGSNYDFWNISVTLEEV
jgi:hypothetical protein